MKMCVYPEQRQHLFRVLFFCIKSDIFFISFKWRPPIGSPRGFSYTRIFQNAATLITLKLLDAAHIHLRAHTQ